MNTTDNKLQERPASTLLFKIIDMDLPSPTRASLPIYLCFLENNRTHSSGDNETLSEKDKGITNAHVLGRAFKSTSTFEVY